MTPEVTVAVPVPPPPMVIVPLVSAEPAVMEPTVMTLPVEPLSVNVCAPVRACSLSLTACALDPLVEHHEQETSTPYEGEADPVTWVSRPALYLSAGVSSRARTDPGSCGTPRPNYS